MATTAQVNININATAANKSVQDLSNQINKAGGSAASLRAELRQVTQELQGLEAGSARFTELSTRAGQLRDRIADTSAVISATAGNVTENFGRALGNTIQIGVAGFQALSSAQVLFGTENEELNKTLAKMGALLNLSQAIETFGGLGDKLTEIKAGFTPLLTQLGLLKTKQTEVAVATTAAGGAMVGEGVAAGGASVATAAFGAALNALPLVAIVTALGLLVAGLINYVSAEGDADKAAKKRKETLKAQNEEQKKAAQAVAKESAGYVLLINQLKATNAGTKERADLIKYINTTYNTTLKNLSDETLFQKQLNLEVANYIAYQKAKFQLQKNEGLVQKNLEKQDELNKKILSTRTTIASLERKLAADVARSPDYMGYGKQKAEIDELAKTLKGYEGELQSAQSRLESYGKVSLDVSKVIKDIEGTTGKYNTTLKQNTKDIKDNNDANKAYEEILNNIKSIQEQALDSEEQLYKERVDRGDKTIDLVERERKLRIESVKKIYEATKVNIIKTVTDEKAKNEQLKNLEDAYTGFYQSEESRRREANQYTQEQRVKLQKDAIKTLLLEEKALNEEIRFGDGDTTDTKIALQNKSLENELKNIDTRLAYDQQSIKEFEELQKTRLEIQKRYFENERIDAEKVAQAEYERQLLLVEQRLIQESVLNKEVTDNIIKEKKIAEDGRVQYVVSLKNKELNSILQMEAKTDEQKEARTEAFWMYQLTLSDDAAKKQAENEFNIATQTQDNINKTSENLYEEYLVKKETADTDYFNNLKEASEKTEQEILDDKIKKLDDYLTFAQQSFQQASSLISQFAQQQQEIRTTQLEDAIALDKERIESQYAEGLISRQQYDNAIEQLEQKQQQQQLQIDRKNFRTEKALNIVGATIDGARAVLGAFAGTPGGIVIKSIAAALAGVFAATQIALIARQEFRAAEGGIVPGDGSGEVDSVPARLAPGEAVINSESTQAFLPLLSAINEMGGGRSFVPDLPATNAPQTFAPVFADNQRREPIRAYVVEADITDAQKRIARIERSTRF
jgi:hypothetical protein